jgi:hypothetical protein
MTNPASPPEFPCPEYDPRKNRPKLGLHSPSVLVSHPTLSVIA